MSSDLKITQRPAASLHLYEKNARRPSKAQIKKLKKSLETFGWVNPLIIDDKGMVLCGAGRLTAALELGMPMWTARDNWSGCVVS